MSMNTEDKVDTMGKAIEDELHKLNSYITDV